MVYLSFLIRLSIVADFSPYLLDCYIMSNGTSLNEIRTMTFDFLYHATFPDCEQTIRQAGIIPSITGSVYLSTQSKHAAGFLRIRNGIKIVGDADIIELVTSAEPTGEIVQTDRIVICTVMAGLLNPDLLAVHREEEEPSGFYPHDLVSFAYAGVIEPHAILNFETIPLVPFRGDNFA